MEVRTRSWFHGSLAIKLRCGFKHEHMSQMLPAMYLLPVGDVHRAASMFLVSCGQLCAWRHQGPLLQDGLQT
jgi:hypothetical protein